MSCNTGPAVHLVNLLPPSASLTTPSVPLVQALLTRANLPLETIALAVCILDSLDSKFARTWRFSCPHSNLSNILTPDLSPTSRSPSPFSNKRHTLPASTAATTSHIDAVLPEIIILGALTIAQKFLEDSAQQASYFYAAAWGRGKWSCEQLNFTEKVIIEALGYRIMPLMQDELIRDALEDMRRAGIYAAREESRGALVSADSSCREHVRSRSDGTAVVGLGLQLTPAETPGCEGKATAELGGDTQEAFRRPSALSPECLHLPHE